jgi:adenosine kinase
MNVIVTGSIAYDYLMRFPGHFAEHIILDQLHQVSLSFLVDDMTKHWGGVAANIAYSMALLGLRPKLMATAGRDFGDYRDWLERAGVNTSTVRQLEDVFTASFFANTDLDNNQISSFYTGAMAYARDFSLADAGITAADLVLISPNDPLAMLNYAAECRANGFRFIYDPSQQVPRMDGSELLHGLEGAYAMIVNAYESEVISKKTGLSIAQLKDAVEILVITHGSRGSVIYHQGQEINVPAFPIEHILDPTGGGDAYRAGFIRGLVSGWPLKLAGEVGSLVAAYVLEHVGTQNHHFTPAEFIERFRTHFDDGGALSSLLLPAATGQP